MPFRLSFQAPPNQNIPGPQTVSPIVHTWGTDGLANRAASGCVRKSRVRGNQKELPMRLGITADIAEGTQRMAKDDAVVCM